MRTTSERQKRVSVSVSGEVAADSSCRSLAVSHSTRREKLAIVGAQAYSLRQKGYSVGAVAAGLDVSVDFIYRALRGVLPGNGTVSETQTMRDATQHPGQSSGPTKGGKL